MEASQHDSATPRRSRVGWLALAVALAALAVSTAQWLGLGGNRGFERARNEDLARTQRRLNALEDRIQRERDDLNRLVEKIGAGSGAEDSLTGRVARLEESVAHLPGGENVRLLWLVEQAEYYLRIAGAQANLAGNGAGALAALALADGHLRDAADPRLAGVRRIIAGEMAALRALPQVDAEGAILRLNEVGAALPGLPRLQSAPERFNPAPAPPPAAASGVDRAAAALRNAALSIVSVRRTEAPAATLLTEEGAALLAQSLDLELQMARLALLRGDARTYQSSVAAVRRGLEKYYDTAAPAGAAALGLVDELGRVRMPDAMPDVSASLTELLRVKSRDLRR